MWKVVIKSVDKRMVQHLPLGNTVLHVHIFLGISIYGLKAQEYQVAEGNNLNY